MELESEDELSVLMDYTFYEVGQKGARVVDQYREQPGRKDQVERELLDAMVGLNWARCFFPDCSNYRSSR